MLKILSVVQVNLTAVIQENENIKKLHEVQVASFAEVATNLENFRQNGLPEFPKSKFS